MRIFVYLVRPLRVCSGAEEGLATGEPEAGEARAEAGRQEEADGESGLAVPGLLSATSPLGRVPGIQRYNRHAQTRPPHT